MRPPQGRSRPRPDATYRRIHENRFCRQRRDPEGAWTLTARGTRDAGAAFNAALGPIIDEIFHTAWTQGRREERQHYAFDALVELARRARQDHDADGDTDTDQHASHADAPAKANNHTSHTETDDTNGPQSRNASKRHRRRRRRRADSPTYLALLRID